MASQISEDELRLLYLDWCSTQVARRFLELSVDEVWLRSHRADSALPPAGKDDSSDPPLPALDRIPGYLDLVRRTARDLAEEMNLPEFAEWRNAYLEDPGAYELEFFRR